MGAAGSIERARKAAQAEVNISQFQFKVGNYILNVKPGMELGHTMRAMVYKGKHIGSGREIAAKRMTVGAKREHIEAAEREADILMHIPPHDNVIKIFNVVKEKVKTEQSSYIDLYIIMELCKLGDLKCYALQRELNINRKLDIMYQCAQGLNHLVHHSQSDYSVMHRDIKPENILLCGDSDSPTVKLSDFEEALFLPEESKSLRSVHGTPSYMAPELYISNPSYKKSADVFSLGLSFLALMNAKKGEEMKPLKGN